MLSTLKNQQATFSCECQMVLHRSAFQLQNQIDSPHVYTMPESFSQPMSMSNLIQKSGCQFDFNTPGMTQTFYLPLDDSQTLSNKPTAPPVTRSWQLIQTIYCSRTRAHVLYV